MSDTVLTEAKRRELLEGYLRAAGKGPRGDRIVRRSQGNLAPLSWAQEELWRRELRVPEIPPLYNECVTLRMTGPLEVVALEQSLAEIIRRHEIWRTTFETRAGEPVQVVHPDHPVVLNAIDLREFQEAEREPEAVRRISLDAQRPFALREEPALRPTLVRMGETEHWLVLVAHLIILDGMSAYQILPGELSVLYQAFSAGRSSPLPELSFQCSDFAAWQREDSNGDFPGQISFWRRQLKDLPPVPVSLSEQPPTATKSYRGALRSFAFPDELSHRIRQLAQRENSTLFLVLLAAFAALLHRITQSKDLTVGTLSSSGRKHNEVPRLLGYFLNPVTLRFNFASDPTFQKLLAQARSVVSEAISNDDVPIEHLARELGQENDCGPSPFFSAAISLQPPTPDLGLNWTVTTMDAGSGGSPWDLYLAFIDRSQRTIGRVQFNPDLFSSDAITNILRDLQMMLQAVTTNVSQPISEVMLG
jgi:Condensation domain